MNLKLIHGCGLWMLRSMEIVMLKIRETNNVGLSIKVLIVVSLFLFVLFSSVKFVNAAGETISAPASSVTEIKTAAIMTGVQINGSDDSTVSVKLLVTNGTLAMSTTTGLTFTGSPTGSTLYFSGLRSNVNTALATLTYTRNTTGVDTLEVSLVAPGEVFFSGNGHLYEYVSSTQTWGGAKTAAEGRTKYGATGYLATITSQAENDFVSARLSNAGWMGASDAASEGAWKWVTGPENGTQFCSGNNPCNSVGGRYTNWNSGEPNDSGGNEDCGQFLSGGSGQWNDLPCSGTTLPGYVVEYGAPGNMPNVAAANVAITTSDSVAPTIPGTPSVTSPTTNQKPTWTWTAATDAGTGLANPAYAVQWSQDVNFSSGVSNATTNSLFYTQPTNLADGTWYFRVQARDVASNYSAYSTVNSVVVDTAAPSVPILNMVTTPINSTTPTVTWAASTDSGAGLANPAYTVEWSQDMTFGSGVDMTTTNTVSLTQPTDLTEGTWYVRILATDLAGNASVYSGIGSVTIDTTSPFITNKAAGSSTTSALISWSTNEPSSTEVVYGPSSTYISTTTELDTGPRVVNHSATLTDLAACTLYHYQVKSVDAAGNITNSPDATFITNGCSGSATVVAHSELYVDRSTGGTVRHGDGDSAVALTVPTNFAATSADFQIKQLDSQSALSEIGKPGAVTLVGGVFDLKAMKDTETPITVFAHSIAVALSYSRSGLQGIIENSLAIYRWDQGIGWQRLENCSVNSEARSVTCATPGFSTFALFGTAIPQTGPALSKQSSAGYPQTETDTSAAVPSEDNTKTFVDHGISRVGQVATTRNSNAQGALPGQLLWAIIGIAAAGLAAWFIFAIKRRRRKQED